MLTSGNGKTNPKEHCPSPLKCFARLHSRGHGLSSQVETRGDVLGCLEGGVRIGNKNKNK